MTCDAMHIYAIYEHTHTHTQADTHLQIHIDWKLKKTADEHRTNKERGETLKQHTKRGR